MPGSHAEELFPYSVCIYSMFTDYLDELEPCVWNETETTSEHCLLWKTCICCDIHPPFVAL